MNKIIFKTVFTSIIEIALCFFLYIAFFNYFPFTQPGGTFMIDGDYYFILPYSYIIGSFIVNFIYFKNNNVPKIRLALYTLILAIITMMIFTIVYAYRSSPSFYFMFTLKIGIYFLCWLLLGAAIQSIGFYSLSKFRSGKR